MTYHSVRLQPSLNLLVAVCALILGACSSSAPEPEPEAKEILPEQQITIDSPQDVLFQTAKQSFQNSMYSVAKDQFDALKNNFPTGPYVDFAEIKFADCLFESRDFDLAAARYEEFAKNHPGSPASAYALIRAARAFHRSSKGLGRDAAQLDKARELYERLLEIYPDSVYAKEAVNGRKSVIDELAAYEKMVADFYRKRGDMNAYEARQTILKKKWAPLVKESAENAAKADAADAHIETFSESYSEEPRVVQVARLKSSVVAPPPPLVMDPAQPEPDAAPALEGLTYQIERVSCSGSSVFLYLNKPWKDRSFLQAHRQLEDEDGEITLVLPDTTAPTRQHDCLSGMDLTTENSGRVVLRYSGSASLLALNNPPRLLLALE